MKAGSRVPISMKIFLLMLILFAIPLLILQTISYSTINKASAARAQALCERNTDTQAVTLSRIFDRYELVANTIATNTEILKNLHYINIWDSRNYQLAEVRIRDELYGILDFYPDILGVCVVGKVGDVVFYDKVSNSNVESFLVGDISPRYGELYLKTTNTQEMIYFGTQLKNSAVYGDYYILTLVQGIQDTLTAKGEQVGSVILYIDEAAIASQLSSDKAADESLSFVTGEEGKILISTNPQALGKVMEDDPEGFGSPYYNETKNSTSASKELGGGKLRLYNFMNTDIAGDAVQRAGRQTILMAVILGIIGIAVSFYYTRTLGEQLKSILSVMDEAKKGNLDVRSNVKSSNEFGIISDYLNHTLEQIKKLMEQSSAAKDRQRVAEIQALEAQINPHFMFNTLDSINWMAIDNGQYEISQMLKNLSSLFRYSVRNSNEIVTVKTEIDYLKQYIYLQQRRYSYGFITHIHGEREILDCHIHKLLLQPLVENCLLHGFDFTQEEGESENIIEVSVMKGESTTLLIQVTDNGKGMEEELMEELNSYCYEKDSGNKNIGIRNVIARVHMYYEEQASVRFLKRPQGGLTVRLELPLMNGEIV